MNGSELLKKRQNLNRRRQNRDFRAISGIKVQWQLAVLNLYII
jgi:hypothetical protein